MTLKQTSPPDRWWEDARRTPLVAVVSELGLSVGRGGSISPCPACGAEVRGKEDRRGPIGLTGDRRAWRCHRCHAHGDAVDLVGAVLELRACGPEARAWWASRGWASPGEDWQGPIRKVEIRRVELPPERLPPDPGEVDQVWRWGGSVLDSEPASRWIASRGLDPRAVWTLDLARTLPADLSGLPTWGRHWTQQKRQIACLLPLWDHQGRLRSLQGRGPRGGSCPRKVARRGFVLASPAALALLRGKAGPSRVLVAEGGTDWLALSSQDPDLAVLGIPGTGGWCQEVADRIPDGATVEIWTDQDQQGERYAVQIRDQLDRRCRILRARWGASDGQ